MRTVYPLVALLVATAPLVACSAGTMLGRTVTALLSTPAPVPNRIASPVRPEARLAVLFIGHATTLIQMDDKFVLTDPVFTETVGQVSRRIVEPGLAPEALPHVDAVLVSHMHFDHLSLGSLSMIASKVGVLVVPEKGISCLPDFAFETQELRTWQSLDRDGLRITAVPVRHTGFRWGVDSGWMDTSFTGYVIQYHGLTVYFGGDTAYAKERFQATAERFPGIDLAVLPISPIEPRAYMKRKHIDPKEAVMAFRDLGARWMVPIHYGTFINGTDAPGDAVRALHRAMADQGVAEDRVHVLAIGQQEVLLARQKDKH